MGRRPVNRMDALLDELCTKYGWCLRQEDWNALIDGAHQDRDAITAAIIHAEFGTDDDERRAWLTPLVDDWLFDPAGRGARSGLPR